MLCPSMLDNWREKLAALIPEKKMKEISLDAGLGPTAVRDILKGRSKEPGFTSVAKIAEQVGVSLDSLAGAPVTKPAKPIMVVGEIAAGHWREVEENGDASDWGFHPVESLFPVDPQYPRASQFDVVVKGTSINKFAREGYNLRCVQLIASGADIMDDDLVVVRRTRFGGHLIETTAKRIKKVAGTYELWPDSDDPRWQEPLVIDPANAPEGETAEVIALVLYAYNPARRAR